MTSFRRLWDAVRCGLHPTIAREKAIELARLECERRGHAWEGPIKVYGHWTYYTVVTHGDWLGGDARIAVDKRDGRIRGFGKFQH